MSADQYGNRKQASKGLRIWRLILLILSLFVGVSAIVGCCIAFIPGVSTLVGADAIIPALQEVPYIGSFINTLIIPGIALLILVLIPQVNACVYILRKYKGQYNSAIFAGVLLVACMIGELVFIPSFLAWIYLVIGALQVCIGCVCLVLRGRQY